MSEPRPGSIVWWVDHQRLFGFVLYVLLGIALAVAGWAWARVVAPFAPAVALGVALLLRRVITLEHRRGHPY